MILMFPAGRPDRASRSRSCSMNFSRACRLRRYCPGNSFPSAAAVLANLRKSVWKVPNSTCAHSCATLWSSTVQLSSRESV